MFHVNRFSRLEFLSTFKFVFRLLRMFLESFVVCILAIYLVLTWITIRRTSESNNRKSHRTFHKFSGAKELTVGNYSNEVNIIGMQQNSSNIKTEHFRPKRNILRNLISKITGRNKKPISQIEIYLAPKSNPKVPSSRQVGAPIWAPPPSYNEVPANAFVAGVNSVGSTVYIGKARYKNTDKYLPGSLQKNVICVQVAYLGYGHCLRNYEVLVGKYKWIPAFKNDWVSKPNIVLGGQEYGKLLYICRYLVRNNIIDGYVVHIGKARLAGDCSVGYNGREWTYINMFEVLVSI